MCSGRRPQSEVGPLTIRKWMVIMDRKMDVEDVVELEDSSITVDDLKGLIGLVSVGECVTFPNGLVVDKRPNGSSVNQYWYPHQLMGPIQPQPQYPLPPIIWC